MITLDFRKVGRREFRLAVQFHWIADSYRSGEATIQDLRDAKGVKARTLYLPGELVEYYLKKEKV